MCKNMRSSADKLARGLRLDAADRWNDGKRESDFSRHDDVVWCVHRREYVPTAQAKARLTEKAAKPKYVTARPDSPFKRERKAPLIVERKR